MKKNKTLIGVLITVGVIIFLLVAIFIYFVISDLKQEEKLKTEINDITTLMSKEDINYTEIDKRLDRTITKGDCAKTEQAAKEYLKDIINEVKTITDILEDEKLINILTVSNYKSDGPNFTKSKTYVANTKTSLIEATKKYNELLTDDKIISYINAKKVDSYYVDLYKNDLIGTVDKQGANIDNEITQITDILNVYEEVLNFLIKNKSSWTIENNTIVFNTDEQVNEYNRLISKIS